MSDNSRAPRVQRPSMHSDPAMRSELVKLGYPWPDHLDSQCKEWLEAELDVLKPKPAA
jgi:hypothetical protein